MNKVAITGLSSLSPLGVNTSKVFKDMCSGVSGITNTSHIDVSNIPSKISGSIPKGDASDNMLARHNIERDTRRRDLFIIYSKYAADMCIKSSGILEHDFNPHKVGVYVGSGIGGVQYISKSTIDLKLNGYKKLSPFTITGSLINLASGEIAIDYGFHGPNLGIVSACASSSHAIGECYNLISCGAADAMIAVGSEAPLNETCIASFARMTALSTKYNECPSIASRPWDEDRDGFVISEGAGCMVLENADIAYKRGAHIYGYISGYGATCDAYHIAAPSKDGAGGAAAMRIALERANLNTDDIDCINAHATSTGAGDIAEIRAISSVFQSHKPFITANKSLIGHTLGAAGIIEGVISMMSLNEGVIPPTINIDNIADEVKDHNIVKDNSIEYNLKHIISNSFGFGGTNASLIFSKC